MNNPLEFGGSVVLIAGGTDGVGGRVAEAFLTAGATVVCCAAHSPEPGPVPGTGRRPEFVSCDPDSPDEIARCLADVVAVHGRLDVLVNDLAGTDGFAATGIATATPRAEAVIRRNLIGPLYFCQAANRAMQDQPGGGVIINLVAVRPDPASPEPGARAAASAGIANLGTSLAVEWAPRVRINTVAVDVTQTEQSDEPATTCLFLASSLAAYISGTRLTLQPAGIRAATGA